MPKPTCSESDCEKVALARELCVTHYHRWNRANRDAFAPPGVCRGCGADVPQKGKTHPAHYCGPDCRPRCVIEGCDKPEHSKGWCSAHATRAHKHGDPLKPLERAKNAGPCRVPECGQPSRKTGLCASHYAQARPGGNRKPTEPKPFLFKWAEPGSACAVCGRPSTPGSGRRKHCSNACQAIDSSHKGARPVELDCAFCGKTFPLTRDRTGRMQRTDTKWCPDCGRESPDVRRFKQYGITKQQYDDAMAKGCELCGAMKPLHVDHDHTCCPVIGSTSKSCGKCVRGFICGPCNRGLGLFFDNAEALDRAAAYLRRDRSMP